MFQSTASAERDPSRGGDRYFAGGRSLSFLNGVRTRAIFAGVMNVGISEVLPLSLIHVM
jgi:hypothetical protein